MKANKLYPYIATFIPFLLISLLGHFFFKVSSFELSTILLWYYFIFFLGWLFFPMLAKIFPRSPDLGYGLSKTLAILFLFWINWISTAIGLSLFDEKGLFIALSTLLILTHFRRSGDIELFEILKRKKRHVYSVEFIYFGIFIFFLVANSFHPELFWGEKPMDFSLLYFSSRNIELPFMDPWFSGKIMNYYYFGHYIFSGLVKMTGVTAEIGYSLSMATIAGLFSSGTYSFILFMTKRILPSIGGAIILCLASNLESLVGLIKNKGILNFNYFWSTTRVFENHLFAEYPSWSFLFNDLHPHVMSYPFLVLFLYFMANFILNERLLKTAYKIETFFFFSLSWASLIAINSWDFIFGSLFFLLMILFNNASSLKINYKKLSKDFFESGALFLFGIFLYLPMLKTLSTGKALVLNIRNVSSTGLYGHLTHYGYWPLISIVILFPWMKELKKRNRNNWGTIKFVVIGWLSLFFLILMIMNITLMDRYNTVFKGINFIHILSGLLCLISFRLCGVYWKSLKLRNLIICSTAIFSFLLLGTVLQIKALNSFIPFKREGPTLYGSRYLEKTNPGDYAIIKWLRSSVRGTPTILERYGRSFDTNAARVSTHTGLPSYLGWDNHVFIRGATSSDIFRRQQEVDFVYGSIDPLKVHQFLIEKGISFLILGPFERKNYRKTKGLDKFREYSDLFIPLVNVGGSTLYGVGNYQEFVMTNKGGEK